MSSQGKSAGFIVALIGGGIGLLAFFALPFLSAFGILSISAEQFASLASQYGSTLGSSFNSQVFLLLWLAPVLAGIAVLISALQFRAQASSRRVAGGWLIFLGILGIALYIGVLGYTGYLISSASSSSTTTTTSFNSPSVLSYLGGGFWAYMLGMIGVIVGGSMGLRSRPAVPPIATVPPPAPYQQPWSQPQQYTQYPPNSQSPYSQQNPYSQQSSQYPPYPSAPQAPQWPSTPSNPYE